MTGTSVLMDFCGCDTDRVNSSRTIYCQSQSVICDIVVKLERYCKVHVFFFLCGMQHLECIAPIRQT